MRQRSSGVLAHITSLPSDEGIGDLGAGAYRFIDFLTYSGQTYWQVLPYHPVGYGYSPYQAYSVFAGNPLLISLTELRKDGLLPQEGGNMTYEPPCGKTCDHKIHYPSVEEFKLKYLRKAYEHFNIETESFRHFCQLQHEWLEDYSLFMALKKYYHNKPWYDWPYEVSNREQEVIDRYRQTLKDEIQYHKFLQYQFFKQWQDVLNYAQENHIKIIGDIPIFVAHDSADTWAQSHLFQLDSYNMPTAVAGVPPDYFSETGQRWGNPLYRWEKMKEEDFLWWRRRFETLFQLVDIVRIDHFRGFESYYEIPATEDTALNGRWVSGPGLEFFQSIEKHLGPLPVIAEDLGNITSKVHKLRQSCGFPGMKVMMFMLETGPDELFRSLFTNEQVLYSGTHDNDTLLGWILKALTVYHRSNNGDHLVKTLSKYLQISDQCSAHEVAFRLLQVISKSECVMTIFPMQDVLGLDNKARMNVPGTISGNWEWRFHWKDLNLIYGNQLFMITELGNRLPKK